MLFVVTVLGRSSRAAKGDGWFTPGQVDCVKQRIRPFLANECYECHGAKKQMGGRRVDFRAGRRKGGDCGAKAMANKVGISDRPATMRHRAGFDHERLTYRFGGRRHRLMDGNGQCVKTIRA